MKFPPTLERQKRETSNFATKPGVDDGTSQCLHFAVSKASTLPIFEVTRLAKFQIKRKGEYTSVICLTNVSSSIESKESV
jgi:hypothetical protein